MQQTKMSRGSGPAVALVLVLFLRTGTALGVECGPGVWTTSASMGVPRQEIGVAAIGETLYAVGGFEGSAPSTTVEAYDVASNTWRTVRPLPAAVHHPGVAVVDGVLYVVGGLTTGAFTAVDGAWAYDPGADAWSPRAPLPSPRGAAGVAVLGGRIFVAGGLRGVSLADFAVYDPATDSWTGLPDMPTARDHLAAAAIDGIFYAVGGRDGGIRRDALEAFDPATGSWRRLAPLPTPRGGLAGAALGGRLFTFGGEGNLDDPLHIYHETEVYDPERDVWARLADMPTPRHGTGAATIGSRIWIPGGATREGFQVSAVTEAFEPPATATLAARPVVQRARRVRVRAELGLLAGDATSAPFGLTVRDAGGTELARVTLPAGSLVPRGGRRVVSKASARTSGLRRVLLQRTVDGVTATVVLAHDGALPDPVALVLEVAGARFCGTAHLRARR